MAKAYGDPTNQQLRAVLRRLVDRQFDRVQSRAADALGVSGSFVSDFLNERRGAGLELLKGLSKYAPLEVLSVLEISLPAVVNLAAHEGARDAIREVDVDERLPAPVVRAMRAAIELTGCTPSEAFSAALAAYEEYGEIVGSDADWWLSKIRDRLPKRSSSGTRPSTRISVASKA